MNIGAAPFSILFLSSVLIVAAIIDVRVKKIPNLLTFPTMAVGLAYHLATNGMSGFIFSFEGLILGIALFLVPYIMGGMGAGDAKLMGAVGAVIGPKGVLIASLLTAVIGGVYALIVFLINIQYLKSFISRGASTVKAFAYTRHFIPIPADESEKKPRLCYGVAIAIGTLGYVFLEGYGFKFPV